MYINLNNKNIRVKFQKEVRLTERFSAGRKYILVQVPIWYKKRNFLKIIKKLAFWVEKIEKTNPGFHLRYLITDYKMNPNIEILGKKLSISIKKEKRKTIGGSILNDQILLKVPMTPDLDLEFLRKGLLHVIRKTYINVVEKEVHRINQNTIQGNIKSVKLKDNFSNWGSCSSTGNINLSIRLLLLPVDVIRYVIIHELCHLKEMNHSKSFWNLVQTHCPNYIESEKWLDKFGNTFYY